MVYVLLQLCVDDFEEFLHRSWHQGAHLRARHGSLGATVFRGAEDETLATVLLRWQSVERFRGFLGDPVVPTSMKRGALLGPPLLSVLDKVEELQA
jgi:hypothetical protein